MKTSRALLAVAMAGLALGLVSAPEPADARGYRGGGHYGGHYSGHYRGWYGGPRVTFGFYGPAFGYWGPGYWGPGYGYGYVAPPVVVVPSEPRVYIERDAPAASSQGQWWYWCQSARGYYPYVSTCSEGWQRVAPQPSQGPQ